MSLPHSCPFDPTGGYSPEELLALRPVIEEPADFAAFWRATFAEALAAPLDWSIKPSAHPGNADHVVFDIEFAGLLGNRIGGWLTQPRNVPVTRGLLIGHGYGGRDAPDLAPPVADAATIQPVCTGLPTRSLHTGIPSQGGEHVLHGIDRRETYVHRHSVMDLWRAASVLHEAVPASRSRLDYLGGSFGGGIGALALPWDDRIRSAYLCVPSFGNHPLRLQLPCNGSGEAFRLLAQKRPELRSVLSYFDAALAARHITIPVLVAAAAFDPSVPPAGQYSVYHSLGGPKELFQLTAGHFDGYPGQSREDLEIRTALARFFA
ncbi:MAG: acetylxylan esterase [Opitutaceae bacterium]|nr:acetylxylan esterase [Opitutaceae bacterium]